jgi:hypothetical protein
MYELQGLVHYDVVVKPHPIWGRAVKDAARGDNRTLETYFEAAAFYAPTVVRFMTATTQFVQHGQQVFALGPGFAHLLHETGCDNIPRPMLRLPYPALYVALLASPWRLWGGSRTGMHDVAGAYLLETPDGAISVAIWAKANEKSIQADDDASFWVCLGLPSIPTLPDDPDCIDLDAYLERVLNDPRNNLSDIGVDIFDASRQERLEHLESVRSIVRVCMNLLLYMNSTNADLSKVPPGEPRKMNKGKRKRLAKEGPFEAQVIWVGNSLEKEGREARSASARSASASVRGSTWSYRRGHFHHYWVGPKKDAEGRPQRGSHRVQKWVAPVRRDMADVVEAKARLHMIKGSGLEG